MAAYYFAMHNHPGNIADIDTCWPSFNTAWATGKHTVFTFLDSFYGAFGDDICMFTSFNKHKSTRMAPFVSK